MGLLVQYHAGAIYFSSFHMGLAVLWGAKPLQGINSKFIVCMSMLNVETQLW
jgi:hypothetical protein